MMNGSDDDGRGTNPTVMLEYNEIYWRYVPQLLGCNRWWVGRGIAVCSVMFDRSPCRVPGFDRMADLMMHDKKEVSWSNQGGRDSNVLFVSAAGAPMQYQWRCDGGCCNRHSKMTTEACELVFWRSKYHCGNDWSTHSHSDVKSFRHCIKHAHLYVLTKAFVVFISVGWDIVATVMHDG